MFAFIIFSMVVYFKVGVEDGKLNWPWNRMMLWMNG